MPDHQDTPADPTERRPILPHPRHQRRRPRWFVLIGALLLALAPLAGLASAADDRSTEVPFDTSHAGTIEDVDADDPDLTAATTAPPTAAPQQAATPAPAAPDVDQETAAVAAEPAPTTAPPAPSTTTTSTTAAPAPPSTIVTVVDWARIAECMWTDYAPNLGLWQSVGGEGYPHEAPMAEQIAAVQALHQAHGWGIFGNCAP